MSKKHIYGGVVLVLATLLAGWYLYGPKPPVPETYAPEARQADGSLVLERKPSATAKPKQVVPQGAKVERVVELTVQPTAPAPSADGQVVAPCPPVQVDLSLVKMPDDSRRVIASSPNGEVLTGVDIPVEPVRSQRIPVWAAGVTANPIDKLYGVFLDRDLGPFRLGAEINQTGTDALEVRLKAGVRF